MTSGRRWDYAGRLADLAARVRDEIFVIMRVYFEKPRTTVGWRGMIIDPHLDYSSNIPEGLRIARRILLAINELGLPTATEVLDPIVPQYTADLVSWAAVGARTTESQTHREMASGAVDAGGLQELHRRQPAGRHRRHRLGARPAPLPGPGPGRAYRCREHPRQPYRSRDTARRAAPAPTTKRPA